MRITATIETTGGNTAGIRLTDEQVAELGGGRRPKVTMTLNGVAYRGSVAPMRGENWIGVNQELRAQTGVAAGDTVDVEIVLDTAPREVVVPADFAAALDAEPAARTFFDGLSYSERRWFVLGVEGAKKAETRAARIVKAVERLASGRGQR